MKLPYYEDVKDWSLNKYLESIDKKDLIYKVWKTGPAFEQKSQSCVGCACAQLLISDPNPKPSPTPEWILKEAKKYDKNPLEGTTLKSGLEVLRHLGHIKSYYVADKIDEILVALLNLGPVIVGVDWYHSMMDVFNTVKVYGGVAGNHALVVYGVNLAESKFLLMNSFGESWGVGGRASISFTNMNKIFKYGFSVEKN